MQSQNYRHWMLSFTKLHLPLSLMLTSLSPPFASPLSDFISLSPDFSSPLLIAGNWWAFSSFPTLYLFFFLCFLQCHLPRHLLTLALLFADFCYLFWKDCTQTASNSTISAFFWDTSLPMWISQILIGTPGIRSSLFCLSLWSSAELPSSQLPCFCFVSFLVPFQYLRAGFSWLSWCALHFSTPNILKEPSGLMYSNLFLVLRFGSLPSKRSLVSLLLNIASGEGPLGKMYL